MSSIVALMSHGIDILLSPLTRGRSSRGTRACRRTGATGTGSTSRSIPHYATGGGGNATATGTPPAGAAEERVW